MLFGWISQIPRHISEILVQVSQILIRIYEILREVYRLFGWISLLAIPKDAIQSPQRSFPSGTRIWSMPLRARGSRLLSIAKSDPMGDILPRVDGNVP